jgi:hypothetical protein
MKSTPSKGLSHPYFLFHDPKDNDDSEEEDEEEWHVEVDDFCRQFEPLRGAVLEALLEERYGDLVLLEGLLAKRGGGQGSKTVQRRALATNPNHVAPVTGVERKAIEIIDSWDSD